MMKLLRMRWGLYPVRGIRGKMPVSCCCWDVGQVKIVIWACVETGNSGGVALHELGGVWLFRFHRGQPLRWEKTWPFLFAECIGGGLCSVHQCC